MCLLASGVQLTQIWIQWQMLLFAYVLVYPAKTYLGTHVLPFLGAYFRSPSLAAADSMMPECAASGAHICVAKEPYPLGHCVAIIRNNHSLIEASCPCCTMLQISKEFGLILRGLGMLVNSVGGETRLDLTKYTFSGSQVWYEHTPGQCH